MVANSPGPVLTAEDIGDAPLPPKGVMVAWYSDGRFAERVAPRAVSLRSIAVPDMDRVRALLPAPEETFK